MNETIISTNGTIWQTCCKIKKEKIWFIFLNRSINALNLTHFPDKQEKVSIRHKMGTTEDLSRTCAKCFAGIGGGRAMKAKDKLYHADTW